MIRVSSFDVFDTCLTRTFAYPIDLFQEVGEISLKNGWTRISPEEFKTRRIAAERAARSKVASREISVAQIYDELGPYLGLSAEIAAEIQKTELSLEAQSLLPIVETRFRVAEARRQGRQVLFLSDMYLPASFLVDLLRKHEFFVADDILYVSGEVGRHKGDGGLFQHARDLLKGDIAEWIHFGDNKHADVVAPRLLGLDAEHFEHGLLNRYELRICPGIGRRHKLKARLMAVSRLDRVIKSGAVPSHRREKWQSRLVAAMRLARLSKPHDLNPREKVIWDTGANLAGPLFYGYVNWVLEQAAARKLPRLYFVARDGQVLLKIAEIIQSHRPDSIRCSYLYGSRHAWLPASLREIDAEHLQWMLATTAGLCVRDVFSRLEIAPEKHQPSLEAAGFPAGTWSKSMTQSDRGRLGQVLQNPELSTEIKSIAAQKREAMLVYLRREGVFEQGEIGMVDLGWRGSLKQALAQICETAPDPIKPRVLGFYFALIRPAQKMDGSFAAYVNSLCPESLGGFLFHMQLLEAFAAADHGQVRGYRQGESVLAGPDNPELTAWGLSALQGGILAFCRTYGALDDGAHSSISYLRATLSVMQLFYEDPTLAEVEAWGSFPFSDQQWEDGLRTLLPAWDRSQSRSALLTKDGRKRLWWAPALAKREKMKSLQLYYRLQKLWRTRLKPEAK